MTPAEQPQADNFVHFVNQTDLQVALALADLADSITSPRFLSTDLEVTTKLDASPVTDADTACERALRAALDRARPHDGIWGEEFGEAGDTGRRWILDPIDGTKNYLRGVPVWATLIGLQEPAGLTVGVVSAPALARRWWAARGMGAFTRDATGRERRIGVSSIDTIERASFSFSDEEHWRERGAESGLRGLVSDCWRTRAYGDFLSHVLVAEGAVDIAAEPALAPWDMAALVPIVTESGGQMTAFTGGDPLEEGCAVTTNGQLQAEVLHRLRPHS